MINTKLIIDNWEDLIRLAGSLKLGHLKAAGVMRILQVRDRDLRGGHDQHQAHH